MKYFITHQNKQLRTQYVVNLLDGLFTDSRFLYCHQICAPTIATLAPRSKYPCRREQNQPPRWAHARLSLDLLLLPPIPPASVKNVEWEMTKAFANVHVARRHIKPGKQRKSRCTYMKRQPSLI